MIWRETSSLSVSVVRGYIRNISNHVESQTSVVKVSAVRVYSQRSRLFRRDRASLASTQLVPSWRGQIAAPLQCGIKPGDGEFLFTGSEHFGEAWLGCAPRYKDFLSVYQAAREARLNSCDFPLDWGSVMLFNSALFYLIPVLTSFNVPLMWHRQQGQGCQSSAGNSMWRSKTGGSSGGLLHPGSGRNSFCPFSHHRLPLLLGDWRGRAAAPSLSFSPQWLLFTFQPLWVKWPKVEEGDF